MSNSMVWFVILTLGLGTFLLRFSFIQLVGRYDLPVPVTRALRFLPAAVLSAIVMPALMLDHVSGRIIYSFNNAYLLAGIIAAIIAWATRSVLIPLFAGMGALWLLQWIMS